MNPAHTSRDCEFLSCADCQPLGNGLSPSPVPTQSVNIRNTTTAGNCLPLSLARLAERLESEQAVSYSLISGHNISDILAPEL